MGVLSNKITRETLKPGDHIYSWRQAYIYAHHGIYVGDDKVIHFTRGDGQEVGTGTPFDRILFSSSPSKPSHDSPCPQCGDQSASSGVIRSCLNCFLDGGDLNLFSYGVSKWLFLAQVRGGTCSLAEADPPEHAVLRASLLLQKGFGAYDLFEKNCEDFAIYCKTGLLVITDVSGHSASSIGTSGQLATALNTVCAFVVYAPLRYRLIKYLPKCSSGYVAPAIQALMYCKDRVQSDIGRRSDTIKVPVEHLLTAAGIGSEGAAVSLQMKS